MNNSIEVPDVSTIVLVSVRMGLQAVEKTDPSTPGLAPVRNEAADAWPVAGFGVERLLLYQSELWFWRCQLRWQIQ